MFIEKTKSYNKVNKAVIERHVENLRKLDDDGYLDRCGVFKGYPGVAGILISTPKVMKKLTNFVN